MRGLFTLAAAIMAAGFYTCAAHATPTMPGPSLGLWDEPYYKPNPTTYYVSTTGNDANNGTSVSQAWATLQHVDNVLYAAGVEGGAGVTVLVEPNTKAVPIYAGFTVHVGGANNSTTGYLAYRCAKMDGCTIAGSASGFYFQPTNVQATMAAYVMIDGFNITASSAVAYGQGVEVWDGNDIGPGATPNSTHHIWVLNSIISGWGQSGLQINDGEYFYMVHNTIFNNATVTCDAQGSGISVGELKTLPGYTENGIDEDNSIVGHIGTFHNAIEWNVTYNNIESGCGKNGSNTSDGNGIIADTFNNCQSGCNGSTPTGPVYPGTTLIAFNVAYNNGGRGIHIFRSGGITVANNTAYNNDLDVKDNGTYRPQIGSNEGYNDTFQSNLVSGVASDPSPSDQCVIDYGTGAEASCLEWNNSYTVSGPGEVLKTNTAYCTGTEADPGYYICVNANGGTNTNLTTANPLWVSPGVDFRLQTGSPAIGTGLTETYLNPQSVDQGACPSTARAACQ